MVMAVMGDDGQYILGYCIPFSKLHEYVSACGIILPQKPLQALQIAKTINVFDIHSFPAIVLSRKP
jgi:FAD/FMN-containing dehydrogenase